MMNLYRELERVRKIVDQTKTVDFILPLTGYSKTELEPYLINAYLGDVSLSDWDLNSPDVFVLLKFSKHIHFYNLEKVLEKHSMFNTSYSLLRGQYIMFVFTLESKFEKDLKKFKLGKYSKLSQPAKKLIMRNRSTNSPMKSVLYKEESLREYWENRLDAVLPIESELWPIIKYDDELFDKSEFKELIGMNVDLPANLLSW